MKNLKNMLLKAILAGIALFPVNTVKSLNIVKVSINERVYPDPSGTPWECAEIAIYNALLSERHPGNYNPCVRNATSLKIILFQDLVATLNSAIIRSLQETERPQGSCKTLAEVTNTVGLNMRFLSLNSQNMIIDREGIKTKQPKELAQQVRAKMVEFILSPAQIMHFLCFIHYPGGKTDSQSGNHGFLISMDKNAETIYVYEDDHIKDQSTKTTVQPQVQAFINQLTAIHGEATIETEARQQEGDQFAYLMQQAANGHLTPDAIQRMGLSTDQVSILLDITAQQTLPMPRHEDYETTRRLIEQLQMKDVTAVPAEPQPQSPTLDPDQLQRLKDLGGEFTEIANQGIITIEVIGALVDPEQLNYILTGQMV